MDKITTNQAAENLGVTRIGILQMIDEKIIKNADKFGRDWMLDAAEIEALKTRPGRGRPAKKK